MNVKEQQLWKKLKAFSPDEPGAVFSFSQRLARENNWSDEYAHRVVEEYKRFLFLCCTTSEQLTPSPAVDQAWHLHMVYTHSYWNDLCGTVLERELHHNPTQGGTSEAQKYRFCYERTLQQYRLKFGKDAEKRFAAENLQWVDTNLYMLLPRKQTLDTVKVALVVVSFGLACAISVFSLSSAWWVVVILCAAVSIGIQNFTTTGRFLPGNDGGCGGGFDSSCSDHHSHHGCSHHGHHGCSGDGGCSSGCSGDGGCSSGCSGCGGGGD
jgi:hypothetical protein